MPTALTLTPDLITADLQTISIPRVVLCYQQVGSTMDIARVQARAGAAEGLLVLADEQTAGRGRLGRVWVAPPDSALLLSLLLRPVFLLPTDAFLLTMLVAVSVCEAIESSTTLRPVLKWPNDVLLPMPAAEQSSRYGKTAGILVELQARHGAIESVIIGCGMNISSSPPADADALYPATSLVAAGASFVERLAVLRSLLQSVDANYQALRAGHSAPLFAAWRRRLVTIGQVVRIHTPAGLVAGYAEDVLPSGALLVRQSDGHVCRVTAGDVAA